MTFVPSRYHRGAPPPPGVDTSKVQNENRCQYPGCTRDDLPFYRRHCEKHREPEQASLGLEE